MPRSVSRMVGISFISSAVTGPSPAKRVTARRTSWLPKDQQTQPSLILASQLVDHAADAGRVRRAGEEVEAVGHVDPAALRILRHPLERPVAADLGQQHLAAVALGEREQRLEEPVRQLRPRLVVEVDLPLVGAGREHGGRAPPLRPGRVVAELRVVQPVVDRVEPEAVDAALEPELGLGEQRLDDVGVVEVEVRLLLQEIVQVVLAAPRLPLPGRAAEHREPVVGRRAVGLGVGPDVPVGLRVVARLARSPGTRRAGRWCGSARSRSAP